MEIKLPHMPFKFDSPEGRMEITVRRGGAVPAGEREFAHVHADHALVPGTALPAPEGVFPRYVEQPGVNA